MSDINSLIEQVMLGRDADAVITAKYEALGPVIVQPDVTAVTVDTQKRAATTTTNPKGPLSMPVDVGTYAIDPQDAHKILFFKIATALQPFAANLLASYPENPELHYKVQDFISNASQRINTIITSMNLGNYVDLAWVAFAYVSEGNNMPLLRNVLYGAYAGEYWMPAYGQCIYQDEDGISSARFDSDYRVFRSMINDYDFEDLIKYASVGGGPKTEEAEVEPNVGSNTQGAAEKEEDVYSVPGKFGDYDVDTLTKEIDRLSAGDMKQESGDSVLKDDGTYSIPLELGLPIDVALDRIKDASTGPVEGSNPIFRDVTTEDLKVRLERLESGSIISSVMNRDAIHSLRMELKRRSKGKLKEDPTTNTGMSLEIDPAPNSTDIDPDTDKPYAGTGAADEPDKAALAAPGKIGGDIDQAIDAINNSELSPEEIVDSLMFNLSDPHPTEDETVNEAKIKYISSGEKVTLTGKTRNIGHGNQVEVIYSDGSKGWEHIEDLQD